MECKGSRVFTMYDRRLRKLAGMTGTVQGRELCERIEIIDHLDPVDSR
jgi:hypothetical protein